MSTGDAGCTATTQIHAGYEPQAPYRPVTVPVHQSAAYEFPDYASARRMFALKEPGFTYTRTGNPTVAVLEQRIAALDGGVAALATATGQAAVAVALLALVRGGEHLVASSKLYGGTVDLLTDTFADFGIEVSFADPADTGAWAAAVRPQTRAFLTESIGNPLATLQDLPALAAIAREAGVPLVVDNTLATPVLYRPLEHGADIVVYSATKFLGGHGAALAGAVVDGGRFDFSAYPDKWPQLTRPKRRYGGDTLWERHGHGAYLVLARSKYLHDLGPSLSPFNAAQILQGLETLDIRVARHGQNTREVIGFLAGHPAVAAVHHPSVPGHPQAGLADRDFPDGTGSVFSFDLAAGPEQVGPFIDRLGLFKLVANVGDTRSLVAHPAAMTHCRLTPGQRAAAGIAETTIRLSVGLEAAADLVADLDQALAPLAGAALQAAGAAVVYAGTEA
ncbi:O-acetylhomoserine aminocarboxypropyltransferase/cysteine synthase family protein [Arthrobacter mobilis]|uniref:O-acetylhomoserine aminocarboxypropyltransferase/cysteine synthase n=1 Tax=Arthrobacter mobilis TaxID=2724944 RepID=A0A7X6HF86_9MICC|nr:PLP-dependent transferase [Arthrobacter mobilis]NKX55124.1 O-acetylhomoserine aminocarboxypropyltransferase/cysteine synthase [Arthrobacter mobilis]